MRRHQASNGCVGTVTLAMSTTISISIQLALAAAGDLWPPTTGMPAVYVFGDSLLDVGNNNYLPGADVPRANMPYYGVDFPGGARPTGRFSDGYNVADLVGTYALSNLDRRRPGGRSRVVCFWLCVCMRDDRLTTDMNGCSEGYGVQEEPAGVPVALAALRPTASSRRQGHRRSELRFWRSWDSRLYCKLSFSFFSIYNVSLQRKKSVNFC